ncbi:extracellular solute-binding protein [Oceanobacillus kapialis]|uniref:Extracellular solute-binding protein n=1 Tax=Oceanobacillus kapialis TaxID=481353 RepID=A0ABW5PX66_9BACI
MKKMVGLAAMSGLIVLGACSNDDSEANSEENAEAAKENVNETGFPIVDEPIEISFMTGKAATNADDYNEVASWKKYEEMTNVKIDWGLVQRDGLDEKRNLALAGGDYPEVFYTSYFSDQDLLKYGQQGVFLPLNDLIEDYMPNVKKLLEENPDIEKGLTFADGNIYSLPTAYSPEFTSLTSNIKPWVKQEWLDTLGMEEPETTEEFYQYLKAVKEEDPNGNGQADEIPFGGDSINGLIGWLKGAYGVGNKGRKHGYMDLDPETEELRFYRTADEYKEMLQYINKLYSEGLIQENIFTIESNLFHEQGAEGLYGSTVTTSPKTRFGNDDYAGLPQLEGPEGYKDWVYVTSPIVHKGSFVMTDKNKNPEATARWIDYFYGDEGIKQLFMGVEGESYEETENGVEYVDEIMNNPDGLTMEQALVPYVTWLGGGYPSLVKQEFFKGAEGSEEALEATAKFEDDIIEDVWPQFSYTAEENQRLTSLRADIEKYANEMQDKFIVGEVPFSEWDTFVETLEQMGLEEYMELNQQAYDRFLES